MKKGLIVFTIGWIAYIVTSILSGIGATETVGQYLSLAAFVVEIVGLAMLTAKGNKNFKWALIGIIAQIVLTVVIVVLAVVAGLQSEAGNDITGWTKAVTIIGYVVNVLDIFVTCSVVEGCAEISAKVKGMARVIEWVIIGTILVTFVVNLLASKFADAATILTIVALVLTLVYQVLIVVILCRTIPKCDEAKAE